jgi:transcriptional regulator with XRE-family HTH domain
MNDVVERLKEIRGILNETQKSMSLRLGMSENTWQSYERGVHFPKFETLEKLHELGFNPGWIVTGEGPMRPGYPGFDPEPAAPADTITIDPVLFGRCLDAINKLFQELNIKAPSTTLGEEAALIYQDVAASGLASLEEQLVAIRALTAQRRRALLAAPPSKQQGSA